MIKDTVTKWDWKKQNKECMDLVAWCAFHNWQF